MERSSVNSPIRAMSNGKSKGMSKGMSNAIAAAGNMDMGQRFGLCFR